MRFLVDGHDLDDADKQWFVDYSALLPASPAVDVAQLRLPSRSGVVTRSLSWGESSLKLAVNVPPQAAFNGLPASPVEARVRALQAALARAREVTTIEAGTVLVGSVVEVDVSEPARLSPSAWRVEALFTLQPFWFEGASPFRLQQVLEENGQLYFVEA